MNTSNFQNLIVFDCDSTLSEIEGVDELGGLKNEAIKNEVVRLTNDAMAGIIPISDVFKKRMDLIRPSMDDCRVVGNEYISKIEPFAQTVVAELQENNWKVVILSGGFAPVIKPLADYLNIDHVEAVPLYFDDNGQYLGFDESYPTTRNGGKLDIIKDLQKQYQPQKTVMVGDGVSDLETRPGVDRFIGFGRYAVRKKVKDEADVFITSLENLIKNLP